VSSRSISDFRVGIFVGSEVSAYLVRDEPELCAQDLSFKGMIEHCEAQLAEFEIRRYVEYRTMQFRSSTFPAAGWPG